jgi:hypothetical protein
MTRTMLIATLTLCSVVLPAAWAEAVLYGADGAQGQLANLYTIDPATGAVVSTVGPIGFAVTGLAVHPTTGVLYGSTANQDPTAPGSLITIDKVTGQGTLVGSYGTPGQTMADLTFTSDGTLYGWLEPFADDLHTIDTVTGLATRVAEFGRDTRGSGLAANADTLFLAGGDGHGPLFGIDRTTGRGGIASFLDWVPQGRIGALSFGPDGRLYGTGLNIFDSSATLLTLDPDAGAVVSAGRRVVTVIGPTVDQLDAIAFDPPNFPSSPAPVPVPTLSELAFVAMAALLAAIALSRMRRRGVRAGDRAGARSPGRSVT